MSRCGREVLQNVREGRESLLDVQKARLVVREWLGGPTGCTGVFRRPPVCSVVVGRPSRMSGNGREDLKVVEKWPGGPPGCP